MPGDFIPEFALLKLEIVFLITFENIKLYVGKVPVCLLSGFSLDSLAVTYLETSRSWQIRRSMHGCSAVRGYLEQASTTSKLNVKPGTNAFCFSYDNNFKLLEKFVSRANISRLSWVFKELFRILKWRPTQRGQRKRSLFLLCKSLFLTRGTILFTSGP